MEVYKPEDTEFIGAIKEQMRAFIKNSEVLDDDTRRKLIQELGSNYHDLRFQSMPEFVEQATRSSLLNWQIKNSNNLELWKQIALANASVSNEPYKVATETIDAMKKQFILE